MSEPTEMDALVARVERIVAIAERQVGCIPEMFHLADADDGRLLQECSAEYPHQCFDEPGHHALTLADLRAVLAQLEAAKRDSARLDWLEAQGNGDQWIARVSANGRGFRLHNTVGQPNKSPTARAAIDAARSSTGGPENG